MIWATRGKSWGFRFLRDGGFRDPLPEYERAFEGHFYESQLWLPQSSYVALRFTDPLGRQDLAGRIITHDFVVYKAPSEFHEGFQSAQQAAWSLVASEYLDLWDQNL